MATRVTTPVVAVAFSGGRDSTALLHAVWRQSAGTDLHVVALHVHHGLMPRADDWWVHCQQQVARWARREGRLSFLGRRLTQRPEAGQSVEAWARRARYQALAEMAAEVGADTVLLAHHQRDQAETVLLQALRGAGPAGLAGMPRAVERQGIRWVRPWLGQPASAIDHYIQRHRLRHIEDDSNLDRRFARNRLRHDVLPALEACFPHAQDALVAVAQHSHDASQLIQEVVQAELQRLGASGVELPLPGWTGMSAVRRRLVLAAWLKRAAAEHGLPPPHASLQTQIASGLTRPGPARWQSEGGLEWRLYRGVLSATLLSPGQVAGQPRQLAGPQALELLDWHARLDFEPVQAGGLSAEQLDGAWLLPRQGGEQFQAGPDRPPRSLKKQFQAAGVPAWQRHAPVLCRRGADGRMDVLFVPGLGVDARHAAVAGTRQWRPIWSTDRPDEVSDPLE